VTPPKPIAVIDTNVIVDLYSWHDFNDHFDSRVSYASSDDVSLDDPVSKMRFSRARRALLLAIHLHNTKAITYSLSESVTLLKRLTQFDAQGKPLDPDERIRREAFTKTFLWFVKRRLLTDWKDGMRVADLSSNEADRALVAFANEHSLPLITNEGFTATGVNPRKLMQRLARESGVRIVQAADFYGTEMDEAEEAKVFFRRFRKVLPVYKKWYVEKHPSGKHAIDQILRHLDRYYYFLLRGDWDESPLKPIKLMTYSGVKPIGR